MISKKSPYLKAFVVVTAMLLFASIGLYAQTNTAPQVGTFLNVRDCKLDGVKADGVTDDGPKINLCISRAKAANIGKVQLPTKGLHIVTPINATNLNGMTISGGGSDFYNYGANDTITELMCDTGSVCLDTAGSRSMKFENFVLRLANTYSTPSNVAIIEGRTSSGGGSCYSESNVWDRVQVWTDHNSAINSGRGYIGIYNVGGEQRKYTSGYISADTPAMFMTTNVLSLTSPYETLGTGCPASMTNVEIANNTFQSTYGHIIESWTTADFTLHGAVFLFAIGTDTRFVTAIAFNGSYATNWHVDGHVEWLRSNNSLMSWGATKMQGNSFTFNLGGSQALGDTHGYIAWPSAGFTVEENTVVLDLHNEPAGYERPFFSNASAETINGGTYVITGSKKSLTATNITLKGTKIIATDFTNAQISFNSASTFDMLTTTGFQLRPGCVSAGASGSSICDTRELLQFAHFCGTTTTCANSSSASFKDVSGYTQLTAGTATVTSITGFSAIQGCTCTDQDSNASCKAVPASISSVSLVGSGTDHLYWSCRGN